MSTPNSDYSQAFSAAIANYRDSAADDVMNNNALLSVLNEKGNADPFDGGVEITEQVLFDEVAAKGWYTGSQQLSVASNDVLTSADFAIKQHYAAIVQDGLEDIQNAGESRKIDLIKAKIKAGMASSQNAVGSALFNSNTEEDGLAIGGLQHLVGDTAASGTIGGIDASSSDNAFWRNYVFDFSANTLTAGPGTILTAINTACLNTERGNEYVDLIVAGTTYFQYFESALQAKQYFGSEETAVAGFKAYKYKGAKVVHDPNCSNTRMYGLNTDYFFFRPWKKRNFAIGEKKPSTNQDIYLWPIYFAGNLTVSSRQRHFVIIP